MSYPGIPVLPHPREASGLLQLRELRSELRLQQLQLQALPGQPGLLQCRPAERSHLRGGERRVTIIVKYFRILNLENNCHTASPDTTGKLTENKIINISLQFVFVAEIIFIN